MSILTDVTRMWLTKSTKPFQFHNEYDEILSYEGAENLGLYIHIPFCKEICSFCPYCKEKYSSEKANRYVDSLIKEIHKVGAQSKIKKQTTSLYFGGGTPALVTHRLKEMMEAVKEHFIITEGIGLELHPENVTVENLLLLKKVGITKISIGIQSFQPRLLHALGRTEVDYAKMFKALKEVPFETISMDFIFALPNQSFEDLKGDIDRAFSNGANHIAIYPFIDFSFTTSKIPAMHKKQKRKLLDQITLYCQSKGYHRDSIWTFSKDKNANYSSMTRDNFLGFGCSATTLLKDQFKVNTFSIEAYEKRIEEGSLPTSLTIRFTKRQRMIYYLFWTAYSTKAAEQDFKQFFGESLKKKYGAPLFLAKKLGFITVKNGVYEMTLKGAFYYHYYENYYTLAYIDKMWGIMRKEAFPKEIHF
jgi:oxygen-independent coproporphyrinogen-3 oxidase